VRRPDIMYTYRMKRVPAPDCAAVDEGKHVRYGDATARRGRSRVYAERSLPHACGQASDRQMEPKAGYAKF